MSEKDNIKREFMENYNRTKEMTDEGNCFAEIIDEYADLLKQAIKDGRISKNISKLITAKQIEIANYACRFFISPEKLADFDEIIEQYDELPFDGTTENDKKPTVKRFTVKYNEFMENPFASDVIKGEKIFLGTTKLYTIVEANDPNEAFHIVAKMYKEHKLPNTRGGNYRLYIHSITETE